MKELGESFMDDPVVIEAINNNPVFKRIYETSNKGGEANCSYQITTRRAINISIKRPEKLKEIRRDGFN